MPHPQLNRDRLAIKPLSKRSNRILIERDHVPVDAKPRDLSKETLEVIRETVGRIVAAKKAGRSVMLAFGAHTIKNGLGPVLIRLMEEGWVTHLATNGAGIIHDWEFAFQGASGEDVRANVDRGEFGIWQETGYFINLAIVVGAYNGLGYGESVGSMIHKEGLQIPSAEELKSVVLNELDTAPGRSAAAADMLETITHFKLAPGWLKVLHPFKQYSVQAAAYRLGTPFTGHPMIGHDIIYSHPMNHGGAIGRTGLRDFLSFTHSVNRLDGGVYMSVGSAIMSPMIFEKALSMCQNLHIQEGKHMDNHFIVVVDLAESSQGWRNGAEPSGADTSYYLRYNKTFSRTGGSMRYASADNSDFLLAVYQGLCGPSTRRSGYGRAGGNAGERKT